MKPSRLFVLLIALAAASPAVFSAQDVNDLKPYPAPDDGAVRMVFRLPALENEADRKVEIVIGKTVEVDCNRSWFSGALEKRIAEGWGYPYWVLEKIVGPASTMMACDEPLMEQDGWLSEFLSASPTIALDGSTLTLTGDDTTITLDEIESAPLIGTTWLVTGTVATQAVSSVPVDSTASITIDADGTVAVDTGCNAGSGSVEITDTTLTFGPIATTRRSCIDELNALEASVLTVLQGAVTYEIDGDSLSLRSSDGEIGLELTAQR